MAVAGTVGRIAVTKQLGRIMSALNSRPVTITCGSVRFREPSKSSPSICPFVPRAMVDPFTAIRGDLLGLR